MTAAWKLCYTQQVWRLLDGHVHAVAGTAALVKTVLRMMAHVHTLSTSTFEGGSSARGSLEGVAAWWCSWSSGQVLVI